VNVAEEEDWQPMAIQRIFLVRHGETAWSLSGQHTSTTDIPLTDHGRAVARQLAPVLARVAFQRVFTSPLGRARETCELAGLGEQAEIDPDLTEWNYGDYEGLTPKQIEALAPGWMLFADGCPHGEQPADVAGRADAVIERARAVEGDVALFAHGHIFRVLGARWIGLPPRAGANFLLDTATLCVLSFYRDVPAIRRWNAAITVEGISIVPQPSGRPDWAVEER
jgi:broad specificity phosphatase PhoE